MVCVQFLLRISELHASMQGRLLLTTFTCFDLTMDSQYMYKEEQQLVIKSVSDNFTTCDD